MSRERTYRDQQCFVIELDSGVKLYARFADECPGYYVVIWEQGHLHGNCFCGADEDVNTLPILDYSSPTFPDNLAATWKLMPAVAIYFSASGVQLRLDGTHCVYSSVYAPFVTSWFTGRRDSFCYDLIFWLCLFIPRLF